MMHFHHKRCNKFTNGEKRLLCKATSVEVLSDQVVDVLKGAPEEASAKLQALLKQVEAKDQTAFSVAFKNKFDVLEENVRKQISENLKNLDVTVMQNVVGSQLDSLMEVVGTPEATDSKEDKKTMYKSATESMGKMWEESGVNPKNWSEETAQNVTAGAGTVLAIVSAYGLYRFGRWFIGGTKKVKNAVVDKTMSFGMGALALGGLAIAGVAGYIGFTNLQKFMQDSVTALGYKLEEGIAGTKKYAADMAEGVKNEVGQRVDSVAENATNAANNVLRQSQQAGDALKDSPNGEAAINGAPLKYTHLLLSQYLGDDKVRDVLDVMERKNWKLGDVLSFYDETANTVNRSALEDRSSELVPASAANPAEFIDAAVKLIEFCGKHATVMREQYVLDEEDKGKNFEDQTVLEFVETTGSSLSIIFNITKNAHRLTDIDFKGTLQEAAASGKTVL
ncbi:MAG: hypothetical protein O3A80_03215, partial [bacterium]|nr:hypothetical protein [bacterium]